MEAIVLYLLLLLGIPVGSTTQDAQAQQEAAAAQKDKKNNPSSGSTITTYGGTGTWVDPAVSSEIKGGN